MQLTKTGTRTSSGTTATDGWLYFRFSDQSSVGANYNITAVYAKFTAIRSASGEFTGDVPVRLVTSGGKYDLGEIKDYTFPANTDTSGTTISGYLTASESTLSALRTATIERIDLGQSTYNGGKDIRCLESSTAEFTIVYEEIPATVTDPTNLKIVQKDNGTFTASWDASTGRNGSGSVEYALWRADRDLMVSDKTTGLEVTCDIPQYNVALQYYVIAYYSGVTASSSSVTVTFTDKLPVWYNGTQLTSITVVKNGVPTKITSLTVVKNGTSTKLF